MSETPPSSEQVPGWLIILNGTSSSGKSSTAKALQKRFKGEEFAHITMDAFLDMMPRVGMPRWLDKVNAALDILTDTVDGFLKRGHNVILDGVFWQNNLTQYQKHQPFLVAVQPDLAILQERERKRGDRTIGQAEEQLSTLHNGISYNFEINNSTLTPEQTADKIFAAYLQARISPVHPSARTRNPNETSGGPYAQPAPTA
jgi:chloramphenicol 3-O phosphotransferase